MSDTQQPAPGGRRGEDGWGSGMVALGFSGAAIPLLQRLQQTGLARDIRWPSAKHDGNADAQTPESAATWLERHWPHCSAVVAVGACGLVIRLIAPLLQDKRRDPAVLVIDPLGRTVIPLLGGHGAGGERLAQELAALLEAQAVLSGSSGVQGQLCLDGFGTAWGWRRGTGDWTGLMQDLARGLRPVFEQEAGLTLWRQLPAAAALEELDAGAATLVISPRLGPGCRWHPPCLWLGVGCERDTSLALLERLVDQGLAEQGLAEDSVAGLASIDRKGDEPALLQLSEQRGWRLRLFEASELAAVAVPHPSEVVAREMGTASVAEAAALLAAGGAQAAQRRLLMAKTIGRAAAGERGAATLAIAQDEPQWAPQRGELHLVGLSLIHI